MESKGSGRDVRYKKPKIQTKERKNMRRSGRNNIQNFTVIEHIYACCIGICLGSAVKNSPVNARDASSNPRLGRFPGEGNGKPLQFSCLGNPMDRGTCPMATVRGIANVRHALVTKPPPPSVAYPNNPVRQDRH